MKANGDYILNGFDTAGQTVAGLTSELRSKFFIRNGETWKTVGLLHGDIKLEDWMNLDWLEDEADLIAIFEEDEEAHKKKLSEWKQDFLINGERGISFNCYQGNDIDTIIQEISKYCANVTAIHLSVQVSRT